MTIKQNGGVFGRNPTFNDVTAGEVATNNLTTASGSEITVDKSMRLLDGQSLLLGTGSDLRIRHTGSLSEISDEGTGVLYIRSYGGGIYFQTGGVNNRAWFNDTGNLAFANGLGIDFSATSGTGTSELFDDYEEGTWTPTYTTDGTNFDSVTYDAVTSGNYTKIGNLVTLVARIRTDAITIGSASGNLVVGGLPFAPSASFGSSSVYASAFAASEPRVLTPATAGILYLYKRTAADGADTIMTASEAGTGANQNTMYFTVSYQTA